MLNNSMRYKRYTLADLEKSASRKRFNVVSFFAGGGGSSCGYKLAGGDVLCVNEFQQVHADTYSANFPNTPVIVDDIKNVTGKTIREKIGDVEIDILDGSPPCPPFSMSGTKQEGWGKEKIAYGMKQQNMDYAREHLTRMISEFERQGYITDYQVMNGWQFGVPQKRERVFIVSIRQDVADKVGINFLNFKSMVFPSPSDENKPLIEDAIRDIQDDPKNIKEGEELCESMKKSAKYKWLKRLEKNPEKVASVGDNVVRPWYLKLIEHRKRMIERVEGYSKPVPEAKFSFFQSRRVPWHQASHTLSEQGLKTSLAVHLHPCEDRVYTTYEAARLMTLPDDYKQTGDLNDRLARIGLMVAPMCMKYLADSIHENVLEPYAGN